MRALRPSRPPAVGAALGPAGRPATATVRGPGVPGPDGECDAAPGGPCPVVSGRPACRAEPGPAPEPAATGARGAALVAAPDGLDADGPAAGRGEPAACGTFAAAGSATLRAGAPAGAAVAAATRTGAGVAAETGSGRGVAATVGAARGVAAAGAGRAVGGVVGAARAVGAAVGTGRGVSARATALGRGLAVCAGAAEA